MIRGILCLLLAISVDGKWGQENYVVQGFLHILIMGYVKP